MAKGEIEGRRRVGDFSVRWDEARAAAAYAEGDWVDETLADALACSAQADPGRVVVIDGDHRLSVGALETQARAIAAALVARAPRGSVISFMLPNWWETAPIYLGVTLAGMVAHPILPSLREHDLRFMLKDAGSRLIFIPAQHRNHDYPAMMHRVLGAMDDGPEVVVLRGDAGGHTRYETLADTTPAAILPRLDPDAVRLVLYTSGTTGRPKGVLHTHNSLHALMRQLERHWLIAPGDTFLVPSPVSHIGGSIYVFEAPLLFGTSAVLMDVWDAAVAVDLAAKAQVTHICGATPFLAQMLDAAVRTGEHLPALKLFVCGGASTPPSLIQNAAAHFTSAAVTRVYGSTEVPVATIGSPSRDDLGHAATTDGRPGVATVKLVAAPGGTDGEGEILARGPQMLAGYLHPEDEAGAFDDDGFYRTGDLGRWVDEDYLVVSGRAKDIIIRNGENISPKEIEDILVDHPEVAEIAIVGMPDPRTGERACAVIVPREGAPEPDVPALRTFLTEKGVATFKHPEAVFIWDALPKNDAGKVLKHRIRADLASARED